MRSPFKFLDPFTLADKAYFFGRTKETRQLYRQVLKTRLLLVYGLSGTGKTSLIQCGLAGEFDGPDWLPLWIRHQTNINESLQASFKRVLPTVEGTISEQIRQLYQHFLRPVYLIFDQFEELFILGSPTERTQFIVTLKTILDDELPCTVLLVIREEYLGRLYPFEKAIPGLFDFRLRVEPMDNANVKTVLKKSFWEFNISVEEPEEIRFDEIIKKVSGERSGIELPYLQVYLDQFYRDDFARTYPNQPTSEDQQWLPITFTKDEIENFGTLGEVLDRFLNDQILEIQRKLVLHDTTTPPDTVKLILDGFVSEEGTKRPVRYLRVESAVIIDPAQREFFPKLSATIITICLNELEKAKILRSEDNYIEIAHDSLAQIIESKRSDKQRERNNMKSQIRLALATFPTTAEYLTRKQLAKFEDVLPQLGTDEREFFLKSRQTREEKEKAELEEEKRRNAELEKALEEAKTAKNTAVEQATLAKATEEKATRSAKLAKRRSLIAACLFVFALATAILALINQKKAEKAERNAITNRLVAEANLRQFQRTEFNAYLLDAETFLKSGDTAEVKTALDSARSIIQKFFQNPVVAQLMQNEVERVESKRKKL